MSNGSASSTVAVEEDRPVRVDLEAGVGLRHVVADHQVEPLGLELAAARWRRGLGLGGEAHEDLVRVASLAQAAQDVGRRLEDDLGDASSFLSLRPAAALGRKSATAAAITTTSASCERGQDRLVHLLGGLDRDDLDAGAPAGRWW